MREFLEKRRKPGLGGGGRQQVETRQEPKLGGGAIQPLEDGGGARESNYIVDQNPTGPAVKPLLGPNIADSRGHGQQQSNYVPSAHEVTTHAGFGSWLSTFRLAPTLEDEERKRLERLVLPESQSVGGSVPPPPGPLLAMEPGASGDYTVVFEGSLRTAGAAHAQFSLPPSAPVTAIIKSLHDKGFDDVLGLSPDDSPDLVVGPSTYLSNPRLITVTSGSSCYSFEKGYLINFRESFVSFFNASIVQPKPIDVTQANDILMVDGGKLIISFHRTLRVPETGETHDLPANLGRFPLFNVANYASRMPGNMAQKGGIFLPLYQREAMYIGFESTSWGKGPQYAIKVFVGGVNAISGKTWDQKSDKQDYIVVPPQPWLDGIATAPGVVKQFVAMPLGSGYSVEKQVTGKEDIGGIQIEIVPAYNSGAGIAPMLGFSGRPIPYWAARWIDLMSSPQDNGYEPGARLYIKDCRDPYVPSRLAHGRSVPNVHSRAGEVFIHDLPSAMYQDNQNQYATIGYSKPKERPAILRDLLDLSSQRPRSGMPFHVKVSHMLTILVQHDGSLEYPTEDTFKIKCSPFAHVSQLEDAINKFITKKPALRNAEFVLKYNGMVLYQQDRTLWEHEMRDTATVQYLCPLATSYQQPAEIPSQAGTYRPQQNLPYQSGHSSVPPQTRHEDTQRRSLREPTQGSQAGPSQHQHSPRAPPSQAIFLETRSPQSQRVAPADMPRGQARSVEVGSLPAVDSPIVPVNYCLKMDWSNRVTTRDVPKASGPEPRGAPLTPVGAATLPRPLAETPPPRKPRDLRPKGEERGKEVSFSGRGAAMDQFRRIKLTFDDVIREGGDTSLLDTQTMQTARIAPRFFQLGLESPRAGASVPSRPRQNAEPPPTLLIPNTRYGQTPKRREELGGNRHRRSSSREISFRIESEASPPPQNSPRPTPAPNWDMGIAGGGFFQLGLESPRAGASVPSRPRQNAEPPPTLLIPNTRYGQTPKRREELGGNRHRRSSSREISFRIESEASPPPQNSPRPTPAPNWDMGIAGGRFFQLGLESPRAGASVPSRPRQNAEPPPTLLIPNTRYGQTPKRREELGGNRHRRSSSREISFRIESEASPPPQNSPRPTPAPNWDMGIAGGGQISQKIHPDTRSRREWNLTLARTLNIQILNSVAFEACTGMLTPKTPIGVDSYINAGLPFFRIYEEGEATVGGFDAEIETVGQIDAGKGVEVGVSVDPNKPTACLKCRVNLCDSILRNCNHTFCSTCVRAAMTTGSAVICAFCKKRADMVLGISAPMPAPGMEKPALTNIVVLQSPKSLGFW